MNGGAGNPPTWFKIAVVTCGTLLIVGGLTFEGHRIEVELDSPQVFSVTTTWWGLNEERTEIRWMKPPGYEYLAWCARNRHGEWYPYLLDYYE